MIMKGMIKNLDKIVDTETADNSSVISKPGQRKNRTYDEAMNN